uniref:Uncharacterized protein n=1 Tax=Caenorhabditis japonica TaxID=281687 RepID=H2WME8_CAEJA
MSESNKNDSTRRHRKSRSLKLDVPVSRNFPSVTFEGAESVDIPADDGKSPVSTNLSVLSNPSDFKFMDEIALLKRGRIDRDAPKHPYNRRGQEHEKEISQFSELSESAQSSSIVSSQNAISMMSFMGGSLEDEREYKVGHNGRLKYGQLKQGGERYELSTSDEKVVTIYQQSDGQTCLFTFKM